MMFTDWLPTSPCTKWQWCQTWIWYMPCCLPNHWGLQGSKQSKQAYAYFVILHGLRMSNGEFTGEFPAQRRVTQSFDVFLDLCLNKWLSKQLWGWWFEMHRCHYDVNVMLSHCRLSSMSPYLTTRPQWVKDTKMPVPIKLLCDPLCTFCNHVIHRHDTAWPTICLMHIMWYMYGCFLLFYSISFRITPVALGNQIIVTL